MFCKNCGKEINELIQFCPNCGKPTGIPAVNGEAMNGEAMNGEPMNGVPIDRTPGNGSLGNGMPQNGIPGYTNSSTKKKNPPQKFNIGHGGLLIALGLIVLSLFITNEGVFDGLGGWTNVRLLDYFTNADEAKLQLMYIGFSLIFVVEFGLPINAWANEIIDMIFRAVSYIALIFGGYHSVRALMDYCEGGNPQGAGFILFIGGWIFLTISLFVSAMMNTNRKIDFQSRNV